MGINLDNYEQYFLEHLEGTLAPEQEMELEAFLLAHPDLRPVLEDLESAPVLRGDHVAYHPKNNLKKQIHPTAHIDEHNADEWMISSLEGLLSDGQQNELGEFLLLNPAFKREMEIYRKTIIPEDAHVIYTRKHALKKKAPLIAMTRINLVSAAVAAVLLLFFGIRYFIQPEEKPVSSGTGQMAAVPSDTGQKDLPPVVSEEQTVGIKSGPETVPSLAAMLSSEQGPVEEPGSISARADSYRMKPGGPGLIQATGVSQMAFIPELRISEIVQVVDPKQPSVISRVAGSILADAGQAIVENTRVKEVRKPRMNFWSMLSSGIKGYNTVTDRDIELLVKKDDEGKITSYALLEQDRLIVMRDRDKN